MKLTVHLNSNQLDDEDLQALTRQLCISIMNETNNKAEIQEGIIASGNKGDGVTLGTILLTLISSGTVVTLLEIFKAYFNRDSSLTIKLTKTDGTPLEINAKNINLQELKNFISKVDDSEL